jgi:uncharacterized membrane protein YvlD (DUF360 family)
MLAREPVHYHWKSSPGLFIFVINAFMLLLTSWIAQGIGLGFRVDKFLGALLGALIISAVSFIMSRALTRTLAHGGPTRD